MKGFSLKIQFPSHSIEMDAHPIEMDAIFIPMSVKLELKMNAEWEMNHLLHLLHGLWQLLHGFLKLWK